MSLVEFAPLGYAWSDGAWVVLVSFRSVVDVKDYRVTSRWNGEQTDTVGTREAVRRIIARGC